MSTVIKASQLSKKYRISHQVKRKPDSLREAVTQRTRYAIQRVLHPGAVRREESIEDFWALKEVSFDISQGERVGIIGRNGAGKSTLLKILSRITEPTIGKAVITGRVASLLEVGTGFHPELTGRENIYLNGAILGMSKSEIRRRFDEIVAFAEVEKFLDTAVKHYSSGMYVRLAFAVAAHLEPEILIVDEVLAVGDAQFQKKCLGKLSEAGGEGRTVLFVSHNMTALQRLCEKVIWLDAGEVREFGIASKIVSDYLKMGAPVLMGQTWNEPDLAPGNDRVRLRRVKVSHADNQKHENFTTETPVDIHLEFWNFEPFSTLNFSMVLYDNQENCIFNTVSAPQSYPVGLVRGICHIPGNLLNDGSYRIRLLLVKDRSIPLIDLDNICSFEVRDINRQGAWHGKWIGAVRPKLKWDTEFIE